MNESTICIFLLSLLICAVPTAMASDVPSISPSGEPVLPTISSSFFLSLEVESCTYDENGYPVGFTDEEKESLASTVIITLSDAAAERGVANIKVSIAGANFKCEDVWNIIDISMVIEGEFQPIVSSDESFVNEPDIGVIAELEIGRDPQAFVRGLLERQPTGGALAKIRDLVIATDVPDGSTSGSLIESMITRLPTLRPTHNIPTYDDALNEAESNSKQWLIPVVVIAAVLVSGFAAYLFWRGISKSSRSKSKESSLQHESAVQNVTARIEEKDEEGTANIEESHPGARVSCYDDFVERKRALNEATRTRLYRG